MAQKHSSTIGRRINPKSNLQIHGPAFEKQEPSRANPSRTTPHNDNVESSLKIRDYEKYQQIDQNIANPELDLESTKKLVASLVSNSRRAKFPPIHKDDDGEVPCKDIETIFTSSKFKENSDLDVAEPFRSSAQILRFTGNAPVLSTSTFVQQEPTTTTTAARRQLPVLGREAFMLPHRSGNNADGMIEFNVIVIGGLDGNRQLLHRFVPSTGHWDVLSAMPEPRRRHSITALQQFVYVAGGKDMQSLKIVDNFWCFDTITRTWSAERSLLEPRAHFGLVTAHQCIYALGGQSATGKALASVHCYDPVIKIWQEIRPMIHARMGAAYARHLNLIVAAGGKNDRGEVLSSVECYDLIAERWQAMPDLTEPRFGACICSVGDSLYVSGGTSNGENRPALSVDVLDCAQSKCIWQLVDCMEEPRTNHGAIVIGSQILLIGGERGGLNHLEGDTIKALCTERRAWIGGFRPLRSSLRGSVDSVLLLVDNNDNIG